MVEPMISASKLPQNLIFSSKRDAHVCCSLWEDDDVRVALNDYGGFLGLNGVLD